MLAVGAYAQVQLNNIDEARQNYDRATQPRLVSATDQIGASIYARHTLIEAGLFYDRQGDVDKARSLWRRALELTRSALEENPESIGLRAVFAACHAFLGEREAFEKERGAALAAANSTPELNSYWLIFLAAADAHLGRTGQAVEVLRNQLRAGRLVPTALLGTVVQTLFEDPAFDGFLREHEARRKQLYDQYASAD